MWGVHPQVYGEVADPLVFTRHAICLILNLLHDGEEVHELLPLGMQKLSILCRSVDQLQNPRGRKSLTWLKYNVKLVISFKLTFQQNFQALKISPQIGHQPQQFVEDLCCWTHQAG